ncbi:MAG: YdcF family protein [Blastocatellia bacterium]|nr:YdcF family protein [Blastocatellia bacterium]
MKQGFLKQGLSQHMIVLRGFVRRNGWKLALPCLLLLFVTAVVNLWIVLSSGSHVYNNEDKLPPNDVGLVLGATPRSRNRKIKPLFRARMEDAAQLYHSGKIKHLLLSGRRNTRGSYNEPAEMKSLGLELGVPESAMTLDYAGYRTLDSVVRAKEVYGLTRFTIITNDFHTYRALFLSKSNNIDAVAYYSEEFPLMQLGEEIPREWLARVKAVIDVYLLQKQPRVLGPRVEIKLATR